MATLVPDKIEIKNNPTRKVVNDYQVEITETYTGNAATATDQKGINSLFDSFDAGPLGLSVFITFADEAARDVYFSANPGDLVEGLTIAITGEPNGEGIAVYTHSISHSVLASELNASHVFTATATATLPEALVVGRWCTCKKNSVDYLYVVPTGTDTIAGNSVFQVETTDLYDFAVFVVEEVGIWAIYQTRGTWVGV